MRSLWLSSVTTAPIVFLLSSHASSSVKPNLSFPSIRLCHQNNPMDGARLMLVFCRDQMYLEVAIFKNESYPVSLHALADQVKWQNLAKNNS